MNFFFGHLFSFWSLYPHQFASLMAFLKAVIFTGGQRKGKAKIKRCTSKLTIPLKMFVLEEAYLLEDPNHICPFNMDY